MDKDTIAKIINLEKSVEEAKALKAGLQADKLEKARLEKDIKILRRTKEEEEKEYKEFKTSSAKYKGRLEDNIKTLERNRANLASSAVPEIEKLNKLRAEQDQRIAKIDTYQERVALQEKRNNEAKNKIEDKKDILTQIGELAKRL